MYVCVFYYMVYFSASIRCPVFRSLFLVQKADIITKIALLYLLIIPFPAYLNVKSFKDNLISEWFVVIFAYELIIFLLFSYPNIQFIFHTVI